MIVLRVEYIKCLSRIEIFEDDKMNQLAYLIRFLTALKGRLNRVCEKK